MPQVTTNLEQENPITAREAAILIPLMLAQRLPNGSRQAVMIWGESGIGKSELTGQIAANFDASIFYKSEVIKEIGPQRGLKVFDFRLNIREPVDMRGVPVPNEETGTTRWFVPDELPKSDGSDGPSLLVLDEINTGTQQMMAVAMQLVLDRRVGDYVVPDNCVIMACGNRAKDSRAVVAMPKPLRKRFAHYTLVVDVESWIDHAKSIDLAPEIIAFIRFRPECLNRDPGDAFNASACPRTIVMCAAYVHQPSHLRAKLFTSLVGKDVASEMESFVALYQSLTDLDDCLNNPKTAHVPTEPSEQYAVATAIARLATRQNFANVIEYSDRLPEDKGMLCVTDATDREPKLKTTPAYGKWAVKHQHLTM